MSAPVSLGQIKERGAFPDGHVRLSQKERDALVELAESYLAVRALERSANRVSDLTKPGLRKAERRLALAAKGVRP